MLLYASRNTYEKLHIQPSETKFYGIDDIYPMYDYINAMKKAETWSEIYEWYVELFYFNKVKYIRAVHLASMFTLYFGDVSEIYMRRFGFELRKTVFKYFNFQPDIINKLNTLYNDSPLSIYAKTADKHRFKSYHFEKSAFNPKDAFFAKFISNGIIDTVVLNKGINSEYLFESVHFKSEPAFHSEEKLAELLLNRYFEEEPEIVYGSVKKQVYRKSKPRFIVPVSLTEYEAEIYSGSKINE